MSDERHDDEVAGLDEVAVLRDRVRSLEHDLLTMKDSLIGAQAENATLKVRAREDQVRLAQVEQQLVAQGRAGRIAARVLASRPAQFVLSRRSR